MSDHARFEELAVGFALDALAPADEEMFVDHLARCATCRSTVDQSREVAAAMAETVGQREPPPELRQQIMLKAVLAEQPHRPADASAKETPALEGRAADPTHRQGPAAARAASRWVRVRPARRLALAAAAAVLGAAIAVPVTLAVRSGNDRSGAQSALVSALAEPGSRPLSLTPLGGDRGTGTAVITPTAVALVLSGLPVSDSEHVYVLWLRRGQAPWTSAGVFDVSASSEPSTTLFRLPPTLGESTEAAVSFEPGHTAPERPTRVVTASPE